MDFFIHIPLVLVLLIWTIYAIFQDLRKREIANWINFSLIAFGLFYRLTYFVYNNDFLFFLSGLAGLGIFILIGNLFYYTNLFGGGDAKLLMAYGVLLPFSNFSELFLSGSIFIFLLLFGGFLWSLLYSIYISLSQLNQFKRAFNAISCKNDILIKISIGFSFILFFCSFLLGKMFLFILGLLGIFLLFLLLYVKGVDILLYRKISVNDLMVGDIIMNYNKKSKFYEKSGKTVLNDNILNRIKKNTNNVVIKDGVPFAPAFLISFSLLIAFKEFFFEVLSVYLF